MALIKAVMVEPSATPPTVSDCMLVNMIRRIKILVTMHSTMAIKKLITFTEINALNKNSFLGKYKTGLPFTGDTEGTPSNSGLYINKTVNNNY